MAITIAEIPGGEIVKLEGASNDAPLTVESVLSILDQERPKGNGSWLSNGRNKTVLINGRHGGLNDPINDGDTLLLTTNIRGNETEDFNAINSLLNLTLKEEELKKEITELKDKLKGLELENKNLLKSLIALNDQNQENN